MALNRNMPIRDPKASDKSGEHSTDYQASRGGWYPPTDKPVPGTPKQSS